MVLIPRCKVWIETEEGFVLGPGGLEILEAVGKHGSIRAAASELGMSYKFVWSYVKRLEKALGTKMLETRRGGYTHGGSRLTPYAERLVETYRSLMEAAEKTCQKYKELLEELESGGRGLGSRESCL